MTRAAVRRRFLHVGDRRVHYRRAGEEPPAVLIHSSPADARLLLKQIAHLSRAHTVFAFDTPGSAHVARQFVDGDAGSFTYATPETARGPRWCCSTTRRDRASNPRR